MMLIMIRLVRIILKRDMEFIQCVLFGFVVYLVGGLVECGQQVFYQIFWQVDVLYGLGYVVQLLVVFGDVDGERQVVCLQVWMVEFFYVQVGIVGLVGKEYVSFFV